MGADERVRPEDLLRHVVKRALDLHMPIENHAVEGVDRSRPLSLTAHVWTPQEGRDVYKRQGTGIAGARVEIESGPQDVGRSTLTDANGVYTLDQLPEGTYSFAASADGYDTASTGPMQIDGGEATSYTFVLPPLGAGDLGAFLLYTSRCV